MQSVRMSRFFILLTILVTIIGLAASATIQKRDTAAITGKNKRPFCNAFTGCGRKRSEYNANNSDGPAGDDVDDRVREIIDKAKNWEQLQNKIELMRSLVFRREDHPAYRKRRSLSSQEEKQQSDSKTQAENEKQ